MTLLWGAVALAAELEAEHVRAQATTIEGEGNVVLRLEEATVRAARFRLAGEALVLWDGTLEREGDTLSFREARVDLPSREALVIEAEIAGQRMRVTADELTLGAGTLRGSGVFFTPCVCEDPPYGVRARTVEVVLDDELRFDGGRLVVCGVPTVPLPAGSVPLGQRAAGVLPPRIGSTQDGLVVGLPAFWAPSDDLRLQVEPEWRSRRGGRLLAETRVDGIGTEGLTVGGFGAYDLLLEGPRWGGQTSLGFTPGPGRLAARGNLVSDLGVIDDYGTSYLGRRAPWTEVLAVAGAGPVRLETDTFQTAVPVDERPVGLVLSAAGLPLGPVAAAGELRADAIELADGGDDLRVRAAAEAGTGSVHRWLTTNLRGRATGTRYLGGDPWLDARIQADATVPFWGELGSWRHLLDVGAGAEAGADSALADRRAPDDEAAVVPSAGPVLRSRWLGPRGVPLAFQGYLGVHEDGLLPVATLHLQERGLAAIAGTRDGVHTASLRALGVEGAEFDTSVAVWERGGWQAQGAVAAWWVPPGPFSEWHPGALARADLETGDILSAGPRLRYRSRCRCLGAEAQALWNADRPVPDLGLAITLR